MLRRAFWLGLLILILVPGKPFIVFPKWFFHLTGENLLFYLISVAVIIFLRILGNVTQERIVGHINTALLCFFSIPLLVILINKEFLGAYILFAGAFLNGIVVFANQGMPVEQSVFVRAFGEDMENTSVHHEATEKTRLRFLCDRFYLPRSVSKVSVVSMGDIFIFGGGIVMTIEKLLSL